MEISYVLTGGIDANVVAQFITWVNAQNQSQSIKKLTLLLSSIGGDVDSAIRAYSYLKGLPFSVEVIGFSQIDSAANTVYLAGKQRKALKGCRFFLHEGNFTIGNPTASLHAHEESLVMLKELLRRNIEIIAKETSKSEDEIRKIFKEGKILNTEEALKFGIVHEIIEVLPSKSTSHAAS